MRNRIFLLLAAGAMTTLCASPALASPINPINLGRPITPNVGDGPGMQAILDSIFACSDCVNAITGQSSAGMWSDPGPSPAIAPALDFEFTANANINTFGIWSGTDTTAITTAQIFSGPQGPGSIASLTWLGPDSLSINGGTPVAIPVSAFGFYIGTDAGKFYSVDQLNPGGAAQMLDYVNPVTDEWVFAFDDGRVGGDHDFNDMVVSAQSLKPVPKPGTVPEPGSMMLFGAGLLGLGGAIRRRLGTAKHSRRPHSRHRGP